MQTSPPTSRSSPPRSRPAAPPASSGVRARLRELALAWMLGIAVVIWPGDSSLGRAYWLKPVVFERALRWRDIIRMRLAPWLAMHEIDLLPGAEAAERDRRPA
jgi:hypothetical protein